MRKATLSRKEDGDSGTFGILSTDSGFQTYTGELPYRSNAPSRSRIPEGVYVCRWATSPKHGPCYYVTDVPDRRDIQIHAGNMCGDVDKNYKSDTEGCILLGNCIGELAGQKCMVASRDAVSRFYADLEHEDFQLTITDDIPKIART